MLGFDDNVPLKYKRRRESVFLILSGLFLGSLTMLNILGLTKTIDFTLFGMHVGFPVGVLPYPITFLCTDFISELYGRRRANAVVWTGLMLNIWVLFILWVGGTLPTHKDADDSVFEAIQSLTFTTTSASMIAYLTAQFIDVHIFHFLKKATKGKHMWLRNNGSTLVSQMVDSVAVILITYFFSENAFRPQIASATKAAGGVDQTTNILLTYIVSSYVFKLISALLDTIPFYFGTKALSNYLKIDPLKDYKQEDTNEEVAAANPEKEA